jgi:general secretion pathway protein D
MAADRFFTLCMKTADKTPLLALLAAGLVVSCSVLPPSMRRGDAAPAGRPAETAATTPADPKAAPARAAADPARIYPGTGEFVATKPPAGPPIPGPEEASLNFEGLDIREVAKVILADYLKVNYTIHPAVAGTVTFRTIRPIPLRDLVPTLEMLLRQNNAAIVQEEGIYKILPIGAVRGSVSPQLGGLARPIPQGFSVIVVPLRYVSVREMQKLLEPFAADNTIRVDETRNLVILAGSQRELRHLVDTVELFDVDWLSGYSVGLFPIKSTDVKSLVLDFDRIFGANANSPLAGVVRVIPIERMNAILVVTTQPRYLDVARTWIERIDQTGGTSGGANFFVYQVRNGKAENLAQLIGDLFSSRRTTSTGPQLAPGARPTELRSAPFGQPQPMGQTTTTTVTPATSATFQLPGGVGTTSGEVRVIADKDTNSLLILASAADYDVIEGALKKLDVVRRQVLVEVLLAEVTLDDNLQFGVDWFIRARNNTSGSLGAQFLPSGGRVPSATNAVPLPFPTGLQLVNLTGTEVRAVLNALGTDGKTQILSSPQIMVLDNEKAEIKVGNRISVQTSAQSGVSTGTGVISSFQYLETGILLAVTPRINSGGMVTLEVNQEVSEAVPGSGGTAINPNPDVSTRNAKTSVVVASGDSIVMGGLIKENNARTTSGLPLLSKIPVLGALFGNQSFTRNRTELVLVITPRIINDTTQAREATNELRDKLPALEKLLPKRQDPATAPVDRPPPRTLLVPQPGTIIVPPGTVLVPPSGAAPAPSAAGPRPPAKAPVAATPPAAIAPPTPGPSPVPAPIPPPNPTVSPALPPPSPGGAAVPNKTS